MPLLPSSHSAAAAAVAVLAPTAAAVSTQPALLRMTPSSSNTPLSELVLCVFCLFGCVCVCVGFVRHLG
jgi:hypothetical protein